ncbi:MAG TPA: 16S rRNA (guanine(966)-N(2))-methyltransferase RsmD [Terriglobales bacterium]|jgi:16S rRNA (guanine(966)-N(2))-methyltransferase RsmD
MRVIAGKYRSRPLQPLPGVDIRPTSDRLRETLFDVLCAGNPAALEGSEWLDLFAGTGAVGIEALSRGARRVTFIESSARAAALIRKNLSSLGIETGFQVTQLDVLKSLKRFHDQDDVDFIFLDPPYRMHHAYGAVLQALPERIKPSSLVIAEHDRKFDPGDSVGQFERLRKLEQGDAALSFYRWK